jgi:signal transduction histidine kinase
MSNKQINRSLIIILIFALLGGIICGIFYKNSPKNAIRVSEFQSALIQKETESEKTVEDMKQIIIHTSIDSLIHYSYTKNDISYFVYNADNLVFWSDNQIDISNTPLPDDNDWHFIQIPNAYCLIRSITYDEMKIVSVIKIKNNYSYENEELVNNFAAGFTLDKQILIKSGSSTDTFAINDDTGKYLFSFAEPLTPIFNEFWATLGLIFYCFAFFIFFVIYSRFPYLLGKKHIQFTTFSNLSVSVGILTGLCLYFNIPTELFLNKLFTPLQYASNPFLTSIIHLTIATVYFLATIYLYKFHVSTNKTSSLNSRFLNHFLFAVYFLIVYYILSGLIYHSSIQFCILHFSDFSFISIWIHFVILLWGFGLALLFFSTHITERKNPLFNFEIVIDLILTVILILVGYFIFPAEFYHMAIWFTAIWFILYVPSFFPKHKNFSLNIALWMLVFTAFLVWNTFSFTENNKFEKYKVLAQNIAINGNTENDRMAEILLEELDIQILRDKKINKLVTRTDSISIANGYLNAKYLRGFWNKYDMRLNIATVHSDLYNEYNQFVTTVGTRIKKTHFFSVPANENNMSYIGVFAIKPQYSDSLTFFMEFYPRRNFKSYSFPNLLIASTPDIQSHLNISIAKYEHQRLVYSSGIYEYSTTNNWIPKRKSEFFKIIRNNHFHYIYAPNKSTYIVITELQPYQPATYLLYFAYTFLAFFALSWVFVWLYKISLHNRNYRIGFTARFQYAFLLLLIISFLGIFYVSVNFIQKKYQSEQIANLESKKGYIQKALQDLYYWQQDLNSSNTQNLNFELQDLSYIYHTDIHVYDNHGILVGSSQPLIFNKSLISKRISPVPIFKMNANMNQYEQIGTLKYLTGYTDFINGDYLQIGFIAVPQFFSQDEIKNEIESFLAVIIHIYLIIIVLAVLLSLFIGKQLSAPLNMMEIKLKEMQLGRRNEKIDYNLNDEIGQLVIQYNRTIDELDQSAKLLARSERESAWKSMARQVAHEINNPLTPMKLTIQQLQRTKNMNTDDFDKYFKKSTAMLIEQIDNLSRIAGTFSNFARMPEANFERMDIASRLYSVYELFTNNYEHAELIFTGHESGIFVYADPEQMVQVFNNLLKNAIQSIPEVRTGKIEIKLETTDQNVIIEISDNGSGIPNEIQDKLFVPNFTTKSNGMGLGLAIAKNIIEISGGEISFKSNQNEGTSFTITLPRAD